MPLTQPSAANDAYDVPGGWPLLGHIVPMLRRPLEFLPALARYGANVVRLRFGSLPVYVITHPSAVREMLVPGDQAYERGRIFEKLEPALGRGIATVSGAEHHRQRKMLQPVFVRERVANYATIMRAAAQETVARWRDKEQIAVDTAMNDLALTALTRSLFRFTPSAETADAIKEGMHHLTHGLLLRTVLPSAWEWVPTPGNIRFRRAIARMHRAIDDVIQEYRRTGGDRGDVLSALLAARDGDGEGLSDKEVHAQVMTLALTGIEAPGAALGWVMHEVGSNPAMAHQLHAELDSVLGGRVPEYDDLERLPYLDRIIEEVLRRHTPLVFMRRTLTDVRIGDATIPANSEVIYSPYMLHHDPRWFCDPYRFDPDRWLAENKRRIPKGAFIPFAAGAYQCIGRLFATVELKMVAATVWANWKLEPVAGIPIREIATALVRPNQLPMIAHRRKRTRA